MIKLFGGGGRDDDGVDCGGDRENDGVEDSVGDNDIRNIVVVLMVMGE